MSAVSYCFKKIFRQASYWWTYWFKRNVSYHRMTFQLQDMLNFLFQVECYSIA